MYNFVMNRNTLHLNRSINFKSDFFLFSHVIFAYILDRPFPCKDGEKIDSDWVCDGEDDCSEGEDEQFCGGGLNLILV